MDKDILVRIKQVKELPFTVYQVEISNEVLGSDMDTIHMDRSFDSREELESWLKDYLVSELLIPRDKILNNIEYRYE